MTLDIKEIRQHLAAATPFWFDNTDPDLIAALTVWLRDSGNAELIENAPVWLAACVEEIERLRAPDSTVPWVHSLQSELAAAMAEIERLREGIVSDQLQRTYLLTECERLRNIIRQVEDPWFVDKTVNELAAWRACADQLVHCDGCKKRCCREALAVYETLKGN
jgi:hypothetical protein